MQKYRIIAHNELEIMLIATLIKSTKPCFGLHQAYGLYDTCYFIAILELSLFLFDSCSTSGNIFCSLKTKMSLFYFRSAKCQEEYS